MDLAKIRFALSCAISLLNSEVQAVEFEDLQNEYLEVIENLKEAIEEIDKNEQMES